MRYRKTALLFLAPFLTVFVAFYLAPVVYAIYLSLFIKKRIGLGPAKEILGGLTNYARAVQDADFLNGLKNMLLFGIVQIPVMLGLAILLPCCSTNLAASSSEFAAPFTSAVRHSHGNWCTNWGYMYAPNLSPFNQILRALHQATIDFLSPNLVLFSIGNIVTWTWTGYNMITLFAALQNIPKDLFEAARVDGATPWKVVRYIKIPLVVPTIRLLFIFSVIGTLSFHRSARLAPSW